MPSKDWKETIPPGESEKFERYATILADIQRARGGKHRALHAKQHAGLRATLEVLEVPDHARVALFSAPKTYDALVRFSNGSGRVESDDKPDVRALAMKILGVPGKKLIPGMEEETTQDFLLINTPALAFRTVDEFVAFAQVADSPALLPFRLFGKVGFGAFGLLSRLLASAKKISSLATQKYFSLAAIRFGDYAARLSLEPNQTDAPEKTAVLADELGARLEKGPISWTLRAQFFVDEEKTPIEDSSRAWSDADAPPVSLARLVIAPQDPKALFDRVESLAFDPWHACEELRPLGAPMRARSPAYRESQKQRGSAKEPRSIDG
ncbi:MAG TPA: hypothetical protein VGH28_07305 [Polyangiaceae bacterium]|jgi:hypothetical protein